MRLKRFLLVLLVLLLVGCSSNQYKQPLTLNHVHHEIKDHKKLQLNQDIPYYHEISIQFSDVRFHQDTSTKKAKYDLSDIRIHHALSCNIDSENLYRSIEIPPLENTNYIIYQNGYIEAISNEIYLTHSHAPTFLEPNHTFRHYFSICNQSNTSSRPLDSIRSIISCFTFNDEFYYLDLMHYID